MLGMRRGKGGRGEGLEADDNLSRLLPNMRGVILYFHKGPITSAIANFLYYIISLSLFN